MKIKTLDLNDYPLSMLFSAETGMDRSTLMGLKQALEQEGCYVFFRIPH